MLASNINTAVERGEGEWPLRPLVLRVQTYRKEALIPPPPPPPSEFFMRINNNLL
jgi:hypothetical protein